MIDVDYADDVALLKNIPAQAEFQLHSLEQVARRIGLDANANKTESVYFKQEGWPSRLELQNKSTASVVSI